MISYTDINERLNEEWDIYIVSKDLNKNIH